MTHSVYVTRLKVTSHAVVFKKNGERDNQRICTTILLWQVTTCSNFFFLIMFVYLIDDITRNQHPPHRAELTRYLYTEGLSSAKLLPHTAHSDW